MTKLLKTFCLAFFFLGLSVAVAEEKQEEKLPERGICAHRGENGTFPENTVIGFQEAVRLGVAMVELDVRKTKDGKLIIMHDDTVDRTTNGHGKVVDFHI
jgi:glycerophosphoryl diester phosphodiesterase